VDAVAGKVLKAGGQAMLQPEDMPGVGRIAVLADPQGAAFGVISGGREG
jgi:predicted enzyme related to lactoylglutathione lyase